MGSASTQGGGAGSTLLGVLLEHALRGLEALAGARGKLTPDFKRGLQRELASRVRCGGEKLSLVSWRLGEIVRGELSLGRDVVLVEAVLEDRGLVGASGGPLSAVFEVGLAWDYVFDLPLVPGSTVKGAFGSLVLLNCAGLTGEERRLECLRHLVGLTGSTGSPRRSVVEETAGLLGLKSNVVEEVLKKDKDEGGHGVGSLVFHDAHLVCGERDNTILEPWVITPHYRGARSEYDAQPTPVEHVVLRQGLRGVFAVALEPRAHRHLRGLHGLLAGGQPCGRRRCLEFLASLLAAALQSGVGARTSRGYSRFRVEAVRFGVAGRA